MVFIKGQIGFWAGKKRIYANPEERNRKISEAMRGEKAWQWKGQRASYVEKHWWIRKWYGSPEICENCKKSGLKGSKIHWANKSGKYKREISDWIRLCAKCHWHYDKKHYSKEWRKKISKNLKKYYAKIKERQTLRFS